MLLHFRNRMICKRYLNGCSYKLNSIVDIIWPNTNINFTKRTFKRRVEEEIFIFDKYKNYLKDTTLFLDVGSNVGMTSIAYYIFSQGAGKIVAIEPLDSCFGILSRLAENLPNVKYIRAGAGSKNSTTYLNVGKNSSTSQASSFLEFTEKYKSKFNYAAVGHQQASVDITRLDDLVKIHDVVEERTFLHIDVEGFEYDVLKGASKILPFIDVIVVEIGVELFEGQASATEIVALLSNTHQLIGTLGAPMMAGGDILVQDYLFMRSQNE